MPAWGAGRVGDTAWDGESSGPGAWRTGDPGRNFHRRDGAGLLWPEAGWGRASVPGPLPPALFGGSPDEAGAEWKLPSPGQAPWAQRGSGEGQVEPQRQLLALCPGGTAHRAGQGGGSLSGLLRVTAFSGHPQRLETLGQVGLCGCLESSENIFSPRHFSLLKGGSQQGREEQPGICSDPCRGRRGGRQVGRTQQKWEEPAGPQRFPSGPPTALVRVSQDFLGRVQFSQKDRCAAGGPLCPPPTGFSTGLGSASKSQPAEHLVARPDGVRLAALTCADPEPGALGFSCCQPCSPHLPTPPRLLATPVSAL